MVVKRGKRFVVRWQHRTKGWWHGLMYVSAKNTNDAEEKVSQHLAAEKGYPAADFDCEAERYERR